MKKIFLFFIRSALFEFSKEAFNIIAKTIIRFLNSNQNLLIEELILSRNYCENDIVYRCGIPFENSFKSDQKTFFWNNIYHFKLENVTEQYLIFFVVKRNMFHAFFDILNDSEMKIEYDNHYSTLSNSQIEETSTNQITSSQIVDLGVTQISQLMLMHQREASWINTLSSQITALLLSDVTSSIASQSLLIMTHVTE